jgi:hypothetical protein
MKQTRRGLLLLTSIWLLALAAPSQEIKPQPLDKDRMERRIAEIQPTAKELRFDEIGWVKGVREAERLAKVHKRPVFLFCNIGDMDIGRC